MEKKRVGFLGPVNTFSYLAAQQVYREEKYEIIPFWPLSYVLDALWQGRVDEIMVPIENALAGEVVAVIDYIIARLLEGGNFFYITKEFFLPIKHCLIGQGGVALGSIKKVLSKGEALAQCLNIIRKYDWEMIETVSTANAVEKVAQSKDRNIAAIASDNALANYNLEIIQNNIGDSQDNITRFIVLSKEQALPSGKDKTTIFFIIEDKSGALCDILLAFKERQINLSQIARRPSRNGFGKYVFWIEAQGHVKSSILLKEALDDVKRIALSFWVIGSYPDRAELLNTLPLQPKGVDVHFTKIPTKGWT